MRTKFQSLQYPEKYGYVFDSEAWRGGEIESTFQMFETCGDGLIQHSHEWAITRDFVADYMASLGTAMLADSELVEKLAWKLTRTPRIEDILFCAGVKWKESDGQYNKRRFYSVSERKVSGAAAKEHDKRYTQIEPWNDGSPEAIYRMLRPEHNDGLGDYLYADTIRQWVLTQDNLYMDMAPEFLKWWDHKRRDESRDLRNAVDACVALVDARQRRCDAESVLDGMRRNHERRREQLAEVAAVARKQEDCLTCRGVAAGDGECSNCGRLVSVSGLPVFSLEYQRIIEDGDSVEVAA